MSALADRYSALTRQMLTRWESAPLASRAATPPRLIAVSKVQPTEAILELYQLGHRDFGENYVQELLDKDAQLSTIAPEIRWHFIGHLQTNKVKGLIEKTGPRLHSIHSIDSLKLAQEVSKRVHATHRSLGVLLEVNLDNEESKSGFLPESLSPELYLQLTALPAVRVEGLMAIPAPGAGPAAFARLARLSAALGFERARLSMGMSDDFDAAITAGSTEIRVGTALFGPRPAR